MVNYDYVTTTFKPEINLTKSIRLLIFNICKRIIYFNCTNLLRLKYRQKTKYPETHTHTQARAQKIRIHVHTHTYTTKTELHSLFSNSHWNR